MPPDIAEKIEAVTADADPGPWYCVTTEFPQLNEAEQRIKGPDGFSLFIIRDVRFEGPSPANVALMIAAPTLLPEALAEIRRLRTRTPDGDLAEARELAREFAEQLSIEHPDDPPIYCPWEPEYSGE